MLLLDAVYGFCATPLHTCALRLHAVYGLFMQTNAANDQLGSTGTATARAEMLLQSLQRHKAATMACFGFQGMAGLVSYMPLAHPQPALQQVFGGVQDCQTVAKIVARLVHATQAFEHRRWLSHPYATPSPVLTRANCNASSSPFAQ